jgi:hypothetical protein
MSKPLVKRNNGRASALGKKYPLAMSTITALTDNVVYAMVRPEFTMSEVISSLFDKDVLSLLQIAAAVARDNNTSAKYILDEATVTIVFDRDYPPMLAPAQSQVLPQHPNSPLMQAIDAVRAIHFEFGAVAHVCEWLNYNATPAAIRYYWPTMAALVPGGLDTLPEGVPHKFTDVPGIADYLPLIKQTAGSVAAALLCPQAPFKREGIPFTVNSALAGGNVAYHVAGREYYVGRDG